MSDERDESLTGSLETTVARVAKNTVSKSVASVIGQGAKGVVAVLIAREMGPTGLGVFMVVWTIGSIVAYASTLGLHTLLVREMNRPRPLTDLRGAMPIALASGVALAAAVAGLPLALGAPTAYAAAFAACSLYIVLSAPLRLVHAIFGARERMEFETVGDGVEGTVAVLAVAVVVLAGGGVPAALLALGVGRGANLAVSLPLERRLRTDAPRVVDRPERWRDVLRASTPMAAGSLLEQVVRRADIVILGILVASDQVGLYSAAAVIVLVAPDLAFQLSQSLYPVFARADGVDDGRLSGLFGATWSLLIIGGISAAVGLTVLASPLLVLIFGVDFVDVAIVLALLAWTVPLQVTAKLGEVGLNATGREMRRTVAVAVAALFNIGANLVLIPLAGIMGAAIAAVITEAILVVLIMVLLSPLRPPVLRPTINGLAISVPVAVAAYWTPGHVLLRVAAGSAVFAGLIWLRQRREALPWASHTGSPLRSRRS